MKIGIISDTHDNLTNIRRALRTFEREGAEAIVHAGDIIAPFAAAALLEFKGKLYAVFGNNDGEKKGLCGTGLDVADGPRRIELGGRVIALAHTRERLTKAMDGADVAVAGHTHRPMIEQGPPLFVNPGECCGWLAGRGTVAMLETDSLAARIVDLES